MVSERKGNAVVSYLIRILLCAVVLNFTEFY